MVYNLEEIKSQIQEVMEYVTRDDDTVIHTEDLFNTWKENKRNLIELLGGLIWQSDEPIEVHKSAEELDITYDDFLTELNFCLGLFEDKKDGLYHFLQVQGKDAFYDNRVVVEYNHKGKKIPVGMKINKAFKLFIKDKDTLNRWQSKHSMVIQRKCFKAHLRLSVHPLDFLSAGTSAHGWSSCHDLQDGHCAGPLSYMSDSSSIVAYLCNPEKDYELATFPSDIKWNSKKWRVMLYVNENNDLVMAGKGYPFEADDITAICIDTLQKIIGKEFDKIQKCENRKQSRLYMEDYDDNPIHYNDCLLASGFYGFVAKAVENPVKIVAGAAPVCIYCGENIIEQPNGFGCKDCGGYYECEICGASIGVYEDDVFYLEDGHKICEDCYDDHAVWCNECGDIFDRDSDDVVFDEVDEEFYCKHCYEEIQEDRNCPSDDDDWFDI